MKKVLIVEDDKSVLRFLQIVLGTKFEVITAGNVEEAKLKFNENLNDLAAIFLDGNIPENGLPGCFQTETVILAREFKAKFFGPMVAISGHERVQSTLMTICNIDCAKPILLDRLQQVADEINNSSVRSTPGSL